MIDPRELLDKVSNAARSANPGTATEHLEKRYRRDTVVGIWMTFEKRLRVERRGSHLVEIVK